MNFSVHLPSLTPFTSILYKNITECQRLKSYYWEITWWKEYICMYKEIRVQGTNSSFRVLNLMSPKARDTEMSPHMRPSTIYRRKFQLCKNKSQHNSEFDTVTAIHKQFSILLTLMPKNCLILQLHIFPKPCMNPAFRNIVQLWQLPWHFFSLHEEHQRISIQ